jgi:hypothetical protein
VGFTFAIRVDVPRWRKVVVVDYSLLLITDAFNVVCELVFKSVKIFGIKRLNIATCDTV